MFTNAPKRSTISDANSKRSYKIFEAIYYGLVDKFTPDLSDSRTGMISNKKIFAIDSTTFSLFLSALAEKLITENLKAVLKAIKN